MGWILEDHLPFILTTLGLPLAAIVWAYIGHVYGVIRRGVIEEPYNVVYMILLFLSGGVLAGVDFVFFKAAYDATYLTYRYVGGMGGSGLVAIPWRFMNSMEDIAKLQSIVSSLKPLFFLSGIIVGMTVLLVLLRKLHRYWYAESLIIISGPLIFLYLETKPIRNMRFSTGIINLLNLQPGVTPWQVYAEKPLLLSLILGFIAGTAVSLIAYLWLYRASRNLRLLRKL